MDNILVSVICTAYNHEKFIKDAIEGVVNQKTNFNYELIVHDDASTDGTASVIREYEEKYPQLIKAIYQKENQYKKRRIYESILFPIVRGKYIAFCEGDDYWISRDKLQKQIDFMESHEEYSMCMHNAIQLNFENGEEKTLNTFPKTGTYSQEEQIRTGMGTNFPAFASYVIRTKFLQGIPDFFYESRTVDYTIRQYYANCGKVYYFEEVMSVYRVKTPSSYMKKISDDQQFYNNYTLKMIRFFEQFDRYTNGKYHDILECKIESDYFGFCLSIEKEEGISKAITGGLNLEIIKECYQRLAVEHVDNSIREMNKKVNSLFIYGTSRVAVVCKKQLEYAAIGFDGFVVSDNQMKPDIFEGKKVYYLSEVVSRYNHSGFILGVQPINAKRIIEILREHKIENYCQPYTRKSRIGRSLGK